MSIVELNDNNFGTEVLESSIPVLVDFSAEWCGPCRMLQPIFEEVANEQGGKIKFARVDIDLAQRTATAYRIRGVPTLILFNKGQVVAQQVGLVQKNKILEIIEKAR